MMVIMLILSSLVAPEVVIMTATGATIDIKLVSIWQLSVQDLTKVMQISTLRNFEIDQAFWGDQFSSKNNTIPTDSEG